MKINKTFIKNLLIIEPQLFKDDRGFFYESYNKNNLDKVVNVVFVQDNESKSNKGVIRGLHFQKPPYAQTKLIRCISGSILDVAVDLRKNSKTYGKSFSVELSCENNKQLFVPKGFAHGFQVISDEAIVNYKADNFYNPKSDSGIIWNDKDLSINWSLDLKPILSEKDLKLISFKELKSPF
jgi:dTDP-4-dehydrorhamnose 3,5-epimerase